MIVHNTLIHLLSRLTALFLLFFMWGGSAPGQSPANTGVPERKPAQSKPLITFVELGSVKCIPCRQMQPVMKSVEEKYGSQIKVVFHDVWTDSGRPYAGKYKIRVIPTQVFLDVDGKEVFRHEGFFPEAEIDKLVQKHGLRILHTKRK